MPALNNPRSVIATSTMELILTPRPRAGYAGIKSRVGFRMITPSPGNGFVVGPRRRSGARFCPAFTAPVQASNPRLQPGGFCFWLWRARQPVDSGFQPEASEAPPVELAAPIWRPIAVRFFFQVTCHQTFIQRQLESRFFVRHVARVEQRASGGAGRGCAAERPLR
jgi:hypothetical protein